MPRAYRLVPDGGSGNGAPGPREGAMGDYGAFVLDPDGNTIEAAYRTGG